MFCSEFSERIQEIKIKRKYCLKCRGLLEPFDTRFPLCVKYLLVLACSLFEGIFELVNP